MLKKFKNLSSWLKTNYTFDYNLGTHAKKNSFYYTQVMFGLNINIQSQKI